MNKVFMLALSACIFLSAHAQKPAYTLFNKKGKKISYQKMLKTLSGKDVVLFGEFHNNPISHWLELEVTKDLKQKRTIMMGAEMIERDNQDQLNSYLQGNLSAKGFDSSARLWKNYPTDYAPLVNFAKENNILFIATNIPRRYASMVARGGFAILDTIPSSEKAWMAPLPIAYDPELPGYKNMLRMMPGHGGENLPKAQAIKDATMAHFILHDFEPGVLFIHYNGAYHSENFEGIVWYLKQTNPSLRISTITTVSQKEIKSLLAENKGRADFIICVDEDMTKTY